MSLAEDGNVRSTIGLLAAWIESQMACSGLPGLSIGVVHDQEPSLPDPMPVVTWLHPTIEHTSRSETRNGFGSHGEPVVFELGPGGNVTRLKVGDNFMTPVGEW